jgi:hypothetical protein
MKSYTRTLDQIKTVRPKKMSLPLPLRGLHRIETLQLLSQSQTSPERWGGLESNQSPYDMTGAAQSIQRIPCGMFSERSFP